MKLPVLYFILALGVGTGLLQLVFDIAKYRYGLIFGSTSLNRFFSALLLAPGVIVFFIWNKLYPVSVVQGAEQSALFALAALTAVVGSLAISSFTNRRCIPPADFKGEGLDVLRVMTFYQAIRRKFK